MLGLFKYIIGTVFVAGIGVIALLEIFRPDLTKPKPGISAGGGADGGIGGGDCGDGGGCH
jgi:hypothetical protein